MYVLFWGFHRNFVQFKAWTAEILKDVSLHHFILQLDIIGCLLLNIFSSMELMCMRRIRGKYSNVHFHGNCSCWYLSGSWIFLADNYPIFIQTFIFLFSWQVLLEWGCSEYLQKHLQYLRLEHQEFLLPCIFCSLKCHCWWHFYHFDSRYSYYIRLLWKKKY